jgi:hypothetical protein
LVWQAAKARATRRTISRTNLAPASSFEGNPLNLRSKRDQLFSLSRMFEQIHEGPEMPATILSSMPD